MSRNQNRSRTHSKRKKVVNKINNENESNKQIRLNTVKTTLLNELSTIINGTKNIFKPRNYEALSFEFFYNYIRKNRRSVIFSAAIFLICLVGYFGIVYESDADQAKRLLSTTQETVSIDLNDSKIDEIEVAVSEPMKTLSIKNEEPIDAQVKKVEEQAAAIEKISSAIITNDALTSTSDTIAEKRNYSSVSESIKLGIDMYAIKVNDKEVAYLQNEKEATAVISTLKDQYSLTDAVEERVEFRENVKIEKVKRDIFDFDGFQTQEQVLEYVVKGTNEQKIHKVKPNESFSYIEQIYNLPYGSLEEANPDIKPSRLQIGQEISLIVAKPIINVVSISKVERVDAIPYGKDPNVKTDKYFSGEFFVKRSGVLGEAEVVVEVYKENGKIIGEKVLNSVTTLEPVNKIVYEGTKPAPPRIGTGTFQRPTSRGYITSGFGARWGSFHNGIDIGLPMRSNVYAADGGVVIYAGWKGTFGKLVIIDHGANMLSYYAHNDQLLVGAGEKIFKGQVISYSGNTGRSTGPHLHFEVRKNNRPVNPRNYVSY